MFGHFSSHTWNVISVLEWRPNWPQRFMKDKYVRWQRPYAVWKVWPHNKVHARYAPLASCPTTGDLPSESLWHTKQFTARHQNILSNCANRLQVFDSRRRLRSASTADLLVPRTTTSFADQAFACAGLRAWNNLPPELRKIKRNDTFRNIWKPTYSSNLTDNGLQYPSDNVLYFVTYHMHLLLFVESPLIQLPCIRWSPNWLLQLIWTAEQKYIRFKFSSAISEVILENMHLLL